MRESRAGNAPSLRLQCGCWLTFWALPIRPNLRPQVVTWRYSCWLLWEWIQNSSSMLPPDGLLRNKARCGRIWGLNLSQSEGTKVTIINYQVSFSLIWMKNINRNAFMKMHEHLHGMKMNDYTIYLTKFILQFYFLLHSWYFIFLMIHLLIYTAHIYTIFFVILVRCKCWWNETNWIVESNPK